MNGGTLYLTLCAGCSRTYGLPCPHESFRAAVEVLRLNEAGNPDAVGSRFHAIVRAWCEACDEPLRWVTPRGGLMPDDTTVEVC